MREADARDGQKASNFELLINMKTAKSLGLPPSLLLRADQVIE